MPQIFNDDAVARIRNAVKLAEGSPQGSPSQFRPNPTAAPREFLVGRADEAISPTTDPLTSGSINSGIVSVYRWSETNSAWEDTGDNVEAYDFGGRGCEANDYVHLHRLGHAGGVLWILGAGADAGTFCYRTATAEGTVMAATLLNQGQIKSVDSSHYLWDDTGNGIAVTKPGWYRAVGRCRFQLDGAMGNHEFVYATGNLLLRKNGTTVPRSNRQSVMHNAHLLYMSNFSDTHTTYTVFEVNLLTNVAVQGDDMVYTATTKDISCYDLFRELVVEMPVELDAGDEITLDNTTSVNGTGSATVKVGSAAIMGVYLGHEAHLALYRM